MPSHVYTPVSSVDRPSGDDPLDRLMIVICGHCGHDALQLGAPVVHLAGDDGDPDSPLHNRGTWIDVPSQCEDCEAVTSLVIGFHKAFIKVAPFARVENFRQISRGEMS